MKDTPDHIVELQYALFFRLTPEERAKQGMDMIDFGMKVLENSIKQQYPHYSDEELRIEKLKRLYADDLPASFLHQAIEAFKKNAMQA